MKRRQWLGLLLALVLTVAFATAAFAADTVEPFTDVPADEYYSEPVAWAVAEKITNGTDDTHFSPAQICTRAQIVTFLYRAADEPEVKNVKNPFVDVAKGTYYENAVLWAVENEITNGTDSSHFSPNSPCTRGQIVTFLYRAAGKPEVKNVKNPFVDVAKGAYYEDAVLWAVQNKITNGTDDTHFSPDSACQRAHAVTFLYRYYHLPEPAYVLMNIPYADFYSAEGVADVDAVSSSTVKTFNQNMAGGSYHDKLIATQDEVKNSSILGVTYPVYVEDLAALADMKEIHAEDKAEITVAAGKSETTTKEVSGADLLFASGDYAYMVLDEVPNCYKTLFVGKDGSFSFSAVSEKAKAAKDMKADLAYGGHYTDLGFTVSAAELEGVTVNGIILTADGQKYALRHVEDIWRVTSLGWNWDGMDGKGLAGKTITNVTYYIKDADGQYQILSYDVNVAVKQNPGRMSAEVTDANTIKFSGLPSDIQNPVATVTHPDPNGQGQHAPAIVDAENVPVVNGVIALDQPLTEGVAYTVTVTSDNYGDTSASAPYYIPAYVLMNIPYADFYAASGVESVDAVSSSTLSKTRNGNLAGGSYHKNADGTDISGVVYPVYVENRTILSSFKQVTDSDSVTIAVNNHGNVSETTYTGKDALFENEDYAYSLLDKAPNSYKTLSVGRDGSYVFSDASVQAKSGEANVEITYGGHHTDITFKVAADGLDQSSTKVNGVVITADGVQYALRHVYEIWRVTELVWNWDQLDGNGLANKTITNVTYYIQNADGEYEVLSFDVHETLLGNPGEMSAEAKDAKTIVLTGLPKDIQNPVAKVTHPDPNGQGHHSPPLSYFAR